LQLLNSTRQLRSGGHRTTAMFETDPMFTVLGAIQAIDSNFHRGYAAEHPELVAAMIQADAIRHLAQSVCDAASTIESSLRDIANAMP